MKNKWYLANLIEFPTIRSKKSLEIINRNRPLYWDNTMLIKALNSNMAYKKAMKIGKEGEYKTINTDGNYVEWKFAGVRELVEVYNELEDGAEIAYAEGHCKNFKKIKMLVPLKNKLSIFEFEHRTKKKKIKNKNKKKIAVNNFTFKELSQKLKESEKIARKALGDINKDI